MFNAKDLQDIKTEYQHSSLEIIARKYNTYPNKIKRALIKMGVQIRDKSEAQKLALNKGVSIHPTKGTKRSQEVKDKISNTISIYWKDLDDKSREERIKIAKQVWDNMSDTAKDKLRRAAAIAIRRSSTEGSKLEQFLRDNLTKSGVVVEFHKEGLIANEKMQIDLFLPDYSTIVEIDGPGHFLPIWGQEKLISTIKSAQHKNGLLLANGFVVIRVKYIGKTTSKKRFNDCINKILETLQDIKTTFPAKDKRLIELEI